MGKSKILQNTVETDENMQLEIKMMVFDINMVDNWVLTYYLDLGLGNKF